MVIGQDCVEPLTALRTSGHEVVYLAIHFTLTCADTEDALQEIGNTKKVTLLEVNVGGF